MEFIDKDKVIAEIERVLSSYDLNEITSGRYALVNLRDFINTLEVKEVDLEKELGKYLDGNDIEFSYQIKLLDFAKHFYELGLKEQKGE